MIRNLQFDEDDRQTGTRLNICPRTRQISKESSWNRKEVQKIYWWKRETQGIHCYAKQKINAMHNTHISIEDAVCLEIIQEKIKLFAMSMYLNIEEQIENFFTKMDQILQFVK